MGSFCPLFLFGTGLSDTTAHIHRLLGPILASLGLTLWELEFKKEGPKWLLRVFIDREGAGVTVDDCEAVSRDLGTVLDIEEVISHAYTLEVSSPGLDRTLSREEHYRASIGKLLKIKLYQAVDGEKLFTGTIKDFQNGSVIIETEKGATMTFSLAEVAKANLVVVM